MLDFHINVDFSFDNGKSTRINLSEEFYGYFDGGGFGSGYSAYNNFKDRNGKYITLRGDGYGYSYV